MVPVAMELKAFERASAPVAGDVAEHSVLDLVPLAGADPAP